MTPFDINAMDGLVIRLQPAPLARRCAAAAIDLLIIIGLTSAAAAILRPFPEALSHLLVPTIGFAALFAYPAWYELHHRGQTIGKRLLGLRAMAVDGLPLTVPQAMIRAAFRVLDLAPIAGLVGITTIILEPHGRRLGDLIAGTLVVHENLPTSLPLTLVSTRRHNSLDTPAMRRRIQARISLEEREVLVAFMLRSERLSDEARLTLGDALGKHLRQRLDLPAELDHVHGENVVRAVLPLCFTRHVTILS